MRLFLCSEFKEGAGNGLHCELLHFLAEERTHVLL